LPCCQTFSFDAQVISKLDNKCTWDLINLFHKLKSDFKKNTRVKKSWKLPKFSKTLKKINFFAKFYNTYKLVQKQNSLRNTSNQLGRDVTYQKSNNLLLPIGNDHHMYTNKLETKLKLLLHMFLQFFIVSPWLPKQEVWNAKQNYQK